ncbi:MAG TPA: GFA family protein [Polyangiales bacterium]|nr:GFA family protein [Polyangiales bacterium]
MPQARGAACVVGIWKVQRVGKPASTHEVSLRSRAVSGARRAHRSHLCNCSICAKKGFIHFIVAPDDFELIRGASALSEYRFNTGVAVHKFCRFCGVHPFYTPRSDPDKVDVNVRCLETSTSARCASIHSMVAIGSARSNRRLGASAVTCSRRPVPTCSRTIHWRDNKR